MKKFIKNTTTLFLIIAALGCNKKVQDVPRYTVSKIFKTDSVTTVNVHISNRITAGQLLLIANKLKTDSAKIPNLEIHYLLPGNTETSAGDNSYYASARYVKEGEIKSTDTLKDDNGNVVRLKIFGLSGVKVKHLLLMQPKEIAGKDVLGRFIDDYTHTVIIPFKDPADKKGDLYIIELDSTAKVVSATMPFKINDNGIEKWMVTQHGDYITIKDSVIGQFAADGLGLPFNSIKSGN
ncbi:MAG TPA: hypothetical protein VGN20_12415 [Mucilaginibacter sp.]|jgi:hypothetical protein